MRLVLHVLLLNLILMGEYILSPYIDLYHKHILYVYLEWIDYPQRNSVVFKFN